MLIELGRNEVALAPHARAIEINRALCARTPRRRVAAAVLAENLNNFGLLVFQGEPSRAEKAYDEAATILEDLMRHGTNRRCVSSLSAAPKQSGQSRTQTGPSRESLSLLRAGSDPHP